MDCPHANDYALTDEEQEDIERLVASLPPLTEEQLDALADTLVAIRLKAARR